MATQPKDLHFVLFPLMAPGHMIPMIDISRLLAQRGVIVTIITTPLNLARFSKTIERATESGLKIRVAMISFPSVEVGLPEGCDNFDKISNITLATQFLIATGMLEEQVEKLLSRLEPPVSCLISDFCYTWTTELAQRLEIPRLLFHGMCCFSLLCAHNIISSKLLDEITSDSEPIVVPGLSHRIELTKCQLPSLANGQSQEALEFQARSREAEKGAYGFVVNSFEELEGGYINKFADAKERKVWCIGPVSLSNKSISDKAERGNKASINEETCIKWLDLWDPSSVIYVCLGSLSRLSTKQKIELGSGLENSNRPFIWCIRYESEEFEKWISDEEYEDKIKGRGLLIRGWAPQVLILSHPSVGMFLTHCGWNSTIEGVCAGIPMMTWPMFAEQFCNERLLVDVLKIGEKAGVDIPVMFGDEEKVGVLLSSHEISSVIEKLMDDGVEGEERRKRARNFGLMANKAIEEDGSSYNNITLLIQDIIEYTNTKIELKI